METLKSYIISLKKTHPTPLPRDRKAAIEVVKNSFEKNREEVFGRLGMFRCYPVQSKTLSTVFTASGGIRFTCFPALGLIAAILPKEIVDFLSKDPSVGSVTEDRRIKLFPYAE